MMKRNLFVFCISLVAVFFLALAGCGKQAELSLNKNSIILGLTEEYQLVASFSDGSEGKIVWTSSDENIATVADGKVTGNYPGRAVIKAESGKLSAECEVTVRAEGDLNVLTNFVKNEIDLVAGREGVTILPEIKYQGVDITDSKITYESLDESVATVSSEGLVEAVKKGTTTVVVHAEYKGIQGESRITVNVTNDFQMELPSAVTIYAKDFVKDGSTPDTYQIEPVVTMNGEDFDGVKFTYSVGDDKIVTVSDTGLLKGVRYGETEVSVTADSDSGESISSKIQLKVDRAELSVDTELEIERYSLVSGDMNLAYADLSSVADHFTTDDIIGVSKEGDAVRYEILDEIFHIENQPKGKYVYRFETEVAYYNVTCNYVEQNSLVLKAYDHFNPYNEQYPTHYQYQTMDKFKVDDGYAELGWQDRVIPGGDVIVMQNGKVGTTTDGLSGDMAISFAADVTDINVLDYDYIMFDVFAYNDVIDDVNLAYCINNTIQWEFRPGGDLADCNFGSVGNVGYMVDENGLKTAFKTGEWQTVVFDISSFTEENLGDSDYGVGGRFIRIIMNNAPTYTKVGFMNLRLMTKEMYKLENFDLDFGFKGDVLASGSEITPTLKIGGMVSQDLEISCENTDLVKVEGNKFVTLKEGETDITVRIRLENGVLKTITRHIRIYKTDNYTAYFGFEGDTIENEAVPVVTLMGEVTDEVTLESSDTSVVQVQNGKFIVIGSGAVTLRLTFKLKDGTMKTVEKAVTAVSDPVKMLKAGDVLMPYGGEFGNYRQYMSYTREEVTEGFENLSNWSEHLKEGSDIYALTWNSATKSNGESGETHISLASDVSSANPINYDYISFDIFMYDAQNDNKIALGINDIIVWDVITTGTDLSEVDFGEYGKIGTLYDENGNKTTFQKGKWLTVRFDISQITTLTEGYNRIGGSFIKVIMDGAESGDALAFRNIQIGRNV